MYRLKLFSDVLRSVPLPSRYRDCDPSRLLSRGNAWQVAVSRASLGPWPGPGLGRLCYYLCLNLLVSGPRRLGAATERHSNREAAGSRCRDVPGSSAAPRASSAARFALSGACVIVVTLLSVWWVVVGQHRARLVVSNQLPSTNSVLLP